MQPRFLNSAPKTLRGHSRRKFFQQGALAAAVAAVGGRIRKAVAAPLEYGANLYRSIGVKPLINAKGTFTIVTGSETLPEVKRAGSAEVGVLCPPLRFLMSNNPGLLN